MTVLKGRAIRPGIIEGEALVSQTPLAFCAGVAPSTGEITDVSCAMRGSCIKNKILVFPSAKGSSAWSKAAYALYAAGNQPAALLVNSVNPQCVSGAIAMRIPMVAEFEENIVSQIQTGDWVKVDGNTGIVEVVKQK
jgi:predicted aconitase with swiveling domain